MNKYIIPIMVILLLLSSSFVGVSNTAEELTVDKEKMEQTSSGVPMDSPEEEWNKTFGKQWGDGCHSVQQIADGGFIITGWAQFYDLQLDVWLIKTDSNGDEQWNKTFVGTESDSGYTVRQTTDTGYIIAGETCSYGAGRNDVWLVKTDAYGNELWNKTFGGTDYDEGTSVQQTTDDGYIITGYTESYGAGEEDVWLIKTDSNGDEQWNKTYGGTRRDIGNSVQQTIDAGYIIGGGTSSYGAGGEDIWLIKTDAYGNELWNKTFGGTENDIGYSVQQTTDDGYIITGYTESYGAGEEDGWLIKVASENQPPSVKFVNPREGYFHFSGIPLFPTALNLLSDTASFGGFRLRPIQVNATDDKDEPEELMVTLLIEDEDKGYGIWNPETGYYEWKWTGWVLGTYRLMVRAKDVHGAISDWASMDVWNFCFLP